MQKIYIRLIDEGTLVFRPVLAQKLNDSTYQIIKPVAPYFDDEKWEFQVNQIVETEEVKNDGEIIMVAKNTVK